MKSENLIEDYILGKLSANQQQTFEAELSADSEMASTVELHRTLLLDEYASGLLDPERKKMLETRLQSDPLLQEELELLQTTIYFTKHDAEFQAFKTGLQKMIAENKQENDKKPGRVAKVVIMWRWPLSLAAGLALLLLAWHLLPDMLASPGERIFSNYDDVKEEADVIFMGTLDPLSDSLSRFKQLFDKGNFADALPIIQKLASDTISYRDKVKYQLYEGKCRLRMKPPDLTGAEKIFKGIALEDTPYKTEGIWYLALTYARNEKWADCVTTLEQFPPSSSQHPVIELKNAALEQLRRQQRNSGPTRPVG